MCSANHLIIEEELDRAATHVTSLTQVSTHACQKLCMHPWLVKIKWTRRIQAWERSIV